MYTVVCAVAIGVTALGDMESSDSDSDNPLAASSVWGFRVASVPEPSTIALLLAGAACLLGFAWRRRTMRNRTLMVVALAGVLTMTASVSQAQVSNVFNMPNGEASLQFVTVGSPGNSADYSNSKYPGMFGSVPYVYQIGKYDVTIGEYMQFQRRGRDGHVWLV